MFKKLFENIFSHEQFNYSKRRFPHFSHFTHTRDHCALAPFYARPLWRLVSVAIGFEPEYPFHKSLDSISDDILCVKKH
jgi:hypothetical protein